MSRRICVVTASRAEYGLLRWVMQGVRDTAGLELQLIVTGAHLAPQFGDTWREIEADGFRIDRRVEMLLSSDTPVGVTTSMGLAMIGLGTALSELQPDILVLLGDRYESLAAAAAAVVAGVPIAHLHGGEASEGAIDDAIRHAVTKMAYFHFVAAEPYARRVIQMGEAPSRVFVVGGLGLDGIKRLPRLDRPTLERELGLRFRGRLLLVTYHPVTLEPGGAARDLSELFAALDTLSDTTLLFTMPNADTQHAVVAKLIQEFAAARDHAHVFSSLGHQRYLSCLAIANGVVGNSSSGLIEAPAFGCGTVNIGTRQDGRLRAASVIDCAPERGAIIAALRRLTTAEFRASLADVRNPYGDGGASARVVSTLAAASLEPPPRKRFYDLSSPGAGGQ